MSLDKPDNSVSEIRNKALAREAHLNKIQDRRRNAVVLVLDYLRSEGYTESLRAVEKETGVLLSKYSVCDNVDLLHVLQQFEEYYAFKNDREIKVVKKSAGEFPPIAKAGKPIERAPQPPRAVRLPSDKRAPVLPASVAVAPSLPDDALGGVIQINGVKLAVKRRRPSRPEAGREAGRDGLSSDPGPTPAHASAQTPGQHPTSQDTSDNSSVAHAKADAYDVPYQPVLKAAPRFEGGEAPQPLIDNTYVKEMESMGAMFRTIQQEILTESPNVRFAQIVGLDTAKRILRESVILPRKYPDLFVNPDGTGSLAWKGLLLYGSPGTGKTILAKALATESRSVFFNVSSSTLTSKYHGDSEKLVRCLFIMARQYESAVIFFDEFDSILSARSSEGEHEASRRMKSEMLQQIDGLTSSMSDAKIFVLGATNFPWDVDTAMLRRLEKRVFIELPSLLSRVCMLKAFLGCRVSRRRDFDPGTCSDPGVYTQIEEMSLAHTTKVAKHAEEERRRAHGPQHSEFLESYEAYTAFVDKASGHSEDLLSKEFYHRLVDKLKSEGVYYLLDIAIRTCGFSGADLKVLCTEACMIKIRCVIDVLEYSREGAECDIPVACTDYAKIEQYLDRMLDFGGRAEESSDRPVGAALSNDSDSVDLSVGFSELRMALKVTQPSFLIGDLGKYIEWGTKFGSG